MLFCAMNSETRRMAEAAVGESSTKTGFAVLNCAWAADVSVLVMVEPVGRIAVQKYAAKAAAADAVDEVVRVVVLRLGMRCGSSWRC